MREAVLGAAIVLWTCLGAVGLWSVAGKIADVGVRHDRELCGFDRARLVAISAHGLHFYELDDQPVYCDIRDGLM